MKFNSIAQRLAVYTVGWPTDVVAEGLAQLSVFETDRDVSPRAWRAFVQPHGAVEIWSESGPWLALSPDQVRCAEVPPTIPLTSPSSISLEPWLADGTQVGTVGPSRRLIKVDPSWFEPVADRLRLAEHIRSALSIECRRELVLSVVGGALEGIWVRDPSVRLCVWVAGLPEFDHPPQRKARFVLGAAQKSALYVTSLDVMEVWALG